MCCVETEETGVSSIFSDGLMGVNIRCRLKIVVRMVVGKSRAMRPGSVACNVFIKNGECLFV